MKTIKENNRLIAEFMGGELIYPNTCNYGVFKFSAKDKHKLTYTTEPTTENGIAEGFLRFNSSWDWLMPVVEKIEGLGYTTEKNYQRVDRDWQFLITRRSNILFQEFNNDSRIACYDAIVNFIEWYNKNRPIEQDK